MKFAETGQLYRGSKPVMWSVVEKTALAEAEVEYHDYQSDMVWVKFPVTDRSATQPDRQSTLEALSDERYRRHLDDDALDDPGQSRDLVQLEDRVRPVRSHGGARRQLGEGRRQA